MKNKNVIIPNINLKKFFRLCAFEQTTPKSINLKDENFRKYSKFKEYLFGEYIKAETYSIFIDKLRKSIISKIIPQKKLIELTNKPLNPNSIRILFSNREISNSSAKALLSLLIKVNLIDHINIIKLLDVDNESNHDKELLNNYLLRRRDFISVKELKDNFSDHPRKHKINEYLLELWIEGKIDIGNLDVPKELCKTYNFASMPPDEVESFNSIETFRVRETGELRARVIIKDNYKLYPLEKGDSK